MAAGVTSAYPVVLLASGLNVPDDLLYSVADGSVLVGEHGDGHLARIGGAAGFERLPQVVPEAEGIAQVGDTIYVADQMNARVVALTDPGIRVVLQLQPVPSGENLDGIASDGKQLIVPDSPHGTVLVVDVSGNILRRVPGFLRPAGVSVGLSGAYLIADENAAAVYELGPSGGPRVLFRNLPGVDDVVQDNGGHILAILPAAGRLIDLSAGTDVARGLRQPQGLGFDGAQNVLVTESGAGRLDLVVRTYVIEVPPPGVQLAPRQTVCLGVLRGPGATDAPNIQEIVGATIEVLPSGSSAGEVQPSPCYKTTCTVTITYSSPSGTEFARFTYRS